MAEVVQVIKRSSTMRIIATIAALLCVTAARADSPNVKAALALASARTCDCAITGECTCGPACKCNLARVKAALALAAASPTPEPKPKVEATKEPPPPPVAHTIIIQETQWETYVRLWAKAEAENVPLVVGVGCPPVVPTGYLGCRVDEMPGFSPGLWIAVKDSTGKLHCKEAPMPPTSSVGDVRKHVEQLRSPRSFVPVIVPTAYMQPVQYQSFASGRSC